MSNVRVFNFKEKDYLTLELNGVKFEVDTADQVFIENLKAFGLKLQNMSSNEAYGEDVNLENIDLEKLAKFNNEAIELFVEGIDNLLGDGATKEIFGEREVNFEDIAELGFFIISEINNYSEKKIADRHKELLEKYSPRRIRK
mgnify:FL=1